MGMMTPILIAISFILYYLGNIAITKGRKRAFHNYNGFATFFLGAALVTSLPLPILLSVGVLMWAFVIYTTAYHISIGDGLGYGDGKGNHLEDFLTLVSKFTRVRYFWIAIIFRLFLLTLGSILIWIGLKAY